MAQYTDILSDETYLELSSAAPLVFHYQGKQAYLEQVLWQVKMSPTGLKQLMLKAIVPALSEAVELKELLTPAMDYAELQAHFSTDLSCIALEMLGDPAVFASLYSHFAKVQDIEDALSDSALEAALLNLEAYQLLTVNVSSSAQGSV